MKIPIAFFTYVEQLNTVVNRWLLKHSAILLRVCTGLVLLEFGLVKLFFGNSPIEDAATYMLTGGFVSGDAATGIVAVLECITGLCFFSSRSLRLGVWLLGVQLVGALIPLVFFSNELLLSLFYTATLAAQYVLTEIVLIAVGIFIALSWNEARLIPQTGR